MDLGRAEQLAQHFLKTYRLGEKGWVFGFNNRKRSLGVCKYARRGAPGGRIELNGPWAGTADEVDVIDTIKHECAHALVGSGHGHDEVWKAMCRKIGCSPTSRADESVSGEMDKSGAKFFAECGSCEQKFHIFRKPKRLAGHFCKKCGPDFGKITWQPMTPSGTVVQHPRSLAEMGLDQKEIGELNKFARGHGHGWRDKIIAIWGGERSEIHADLGVILGLDEKIRAYLSSINFRFHMEGCRA